MTRKIMKATTPAQDTLPDNIEGIIDRAVASALERLNLDALIHEAIRKMDITAIVRKVIAEVG